MTRSDRLGAVMFLVLLAASSAAPQAAAQDADPKRAFDEGRALVKDGLYAEALAKFEESYRIKATPGAILNIADCYEKLGRYASAMEAFDRAIALSKAGGQAERAEVAEQRKLAIAPLVSILMIESAQSDLAVSLDGRPVAVGEPLPVDGGEHVVRVEARCRAPHEQRIQVGLRADEQRVTAEPGDPAPGPGCSAAPAPAPVLASPPPPPARPEDASHAWSPQRTLALVLGGTGAAALGIGTGFGLSAASKRGQLDDACASYPTGCPVSRRGELDATYHDARSAATISTVGFVTGVALAGIAVALYLTAPPARAKAPASVGYAF